MKLRYWKYDNPFVYPFTISKGTKTHQPCLVVELEHFGLKGYGEAPAISYYHITVEQMMADIERKKLFIEKYAFTEPDRYWHYLHHLLPQNNFLVCALDIAAWDLYGKMRGMPLYKLWDYQLDNLPQTDYTIGMDTTEKMLDKIKAKPWPIYKIKVGTREDVSILRAIRRQSNAILRVDANGGWTLDEALQLVDQLAELGVELIEQPLEKDAWDAMKILREKSIIPLFADEACVQETDVARCAVSFDGINIKLTKCGGITPARRMIAAAEQLGLRIMIGCMNETTIGSAAIAHLLPKVEFADLDGPLLLAQDIATGLQYENGNVIISSKSGLGIEFDARNPYSSFTIA